MHDTLDLCTLPESHHPSPSKEQQLAPQGYMEEGDDELGLPVQMCIICSIFTFPT